MVPDQLLNDDNTYTPPQNVDYEANEKIESHTTDPIPPVPKPRSTSISHKVLPTQFSEISIDSTSLSEIHSVESSDEAKDPQAKFYIGESSTNIIKKSSELSESSTESFDKFDKMRSEQQIVDDIKQLNDIFQETDASISSLTFEGTDSKKQHRPSKIPHFDRTIQKTETQVDKSEFEFSEKKVKHEEKHFESKIPIHHASEWKTVEMHSPVKSLPSTTYFEQSYEIEGNDEILSPKATATSVEVISDPLSKGAKPKMPKPSPWLEKLDPDTIDEKMLEDTLNEITESLEAVEENLIEVVKDGHRIKESPSEFEFKIMSQMRFNQDLRHDRFDHDSNESRTKQLEQMFERSSKLQQESDDNSQLSSLEDSFTNLKVKKRKTTELLPQVDPESSSGESHYQSFERTDSSRPCSSDIENLMTLATSSEYQSARDQSQLPTEYHSAVSTLHSRTNSNRDSMKSFDSESSGNIDNIEVSEASETLVPSAAEIDNESVDIQDYDLEKDIDDDSFMVLLDQKSDTKSDEIPANMKRSHEMIFLSEGTVDTAETVAEPKIDEFIDKKIEPTQPIQITSSSSTHTTSSSETPKLADSFDESRFGSLEDGSILSLSASSASCLETIVELSNRDNLDYLSESFIESHALASSLHDTDDLTFSRIENFTFAPSLPQDHDSIFSQSVTSTTSDGTKETTKRTKGHKRSESTVPAAVLLETQPPAQEEIAIIEETPIYTSEISGGGVSGGAADSKESDTDSEYDRYESEYSRAFKSPAKKEDHRKEKTKDKPDPKVAEVIAEDVVMETELERELELKMLRNENMQDYSNIPDITITKETKSIDEPTEIASKEIEVKEISKVEAKQTFPTSKSYEKEIQFAKQEELTISEDQYEELIAKQYKLKREDSADFDDRADSAGSDSFEMLEQPDISDEFIIIEEVAKEADEFDREGKSLSIQKTKHIKKHDEEVENIVIKSAPAATNAGSMAYEALCAGMNFEFEDSPPTDENNRSAGVSTQDLIPGDIDSAINANKKWVEMQMTTGRYPYEIAGAYLEDIKEEDTDFEVGSSRISSFKDSFSSTPDYDILAGRKYFSKENDNISMNSLQEFENLEQVISLENRRLNQAQNQSSSDSLSNGSFPKRYVVGSVEGEGITSSSLREFEALESTCMEAHLIEIKAREEAALLLSKSDDSNKSDKLKSSPPRQSPPKQTTSTVVKTVTRMGPDASTITKETTTTSIQSSGSSKHLDDSLIQTQSSREIVSDSLDQSHDNLRREQSQHASNDSLDNIRSNIDVMTSSIDSIELMSKALTGKSSRSEPDSIEQIPNTGRSDSIDSIELQLALLNQQSKFDNDSIEDNIITDQSDSGSKFLQTTTTTTTVTKTSMERDISNDSLTSGGYVNQLEQDLFTTSVDSFDHTSSTATNATYCNESQMSGSITSCDSNTMIDNVDSISFDPHSMDSDFQSFIERDSRFTSSITTTSSTSTGQSVTTTTTTMSSGSGAGGVNQTVTSTVVRTSSNVDQKYYNDPRSSGTYKKFIL